MHFREMKMEILTEGLERPDQPLDIAIEYDDAVETFELRSQSRPEMKDARMIGLAIPNSTTLSKEGFAAPNSVAAEVLGPRMPGPPSFRSMGPPSGPTRLSP